jgi:hypothetical protein
MACSWPLMTAKDKSPGIPAKKGFSGLFSGGLFSKLVLARKQWAV